MSNIPPTKRLQVTLTAMRRASPRTLVLRLRFAAGEVFGYRPGQFIGIDAPDGRQRFFSIANADPVGNELELHVGRAPGGAFTGVLFEQAQVGDHFWLEGPYGGFSIPTDASAGSIIVAGGTGFAPIKACLERIAAMRAGAQAHQPLHLYWGARSVEDLYDLASLGALAERLPGLRFILVLDQGPADRAARAGLVHRAVIEDFDDLSDHDIYACGAPGMIEALSRDCAAERGFDPARLVADLFTSGPPDAGRQPPAEGKRVGLFLDRDARPWAIPAVEGEALVFPLKRAGAELKAVCGGKGACGTCRVNVAPAWRSRTGEPTRREARLLQYLGADEGDRLSCQILLTAELDGLELHTCADSKKETHDEHRSSGEVTARRSG